jgi:hypothetical protein
MAAKKRNAGENRCNSGHQRKWHGNISRKKVSANLASINSIMAKAAISAAASISRNGVQNSAGRRYGGENIGERNSAQAKKKEEKRRKSNNMAMAAA